MNYETIGGKIKSTSDGFTILRFLRVGDRFKTKKGKGLFEVWDDKCRFNGPAGSSTRKCKNLNNGLFEHKLCRIEVIKI